MSTSPQQTPQPIVSASVLPQMAAEAALVQSSAISAGDGATGMNPRMYLLPVEIDVSVPVRKFRIRDLLTLQEGSVIASQWVQGDDLPLAAPGTQLAWTEFEVVEQKLAVRITRLV